MGVIFLSGFETRDFKEWTSTSGTPSINTSVQRSGDACAQLEASEILNYQHGSTLPDFACSFGFRGEDLPSFTNTIFEVVDSGFNAVLRLVWRDDGKLEITTPGSTVGSATLSADVQYMIHVTHNYVDGSNDEIKIYIDDDATPDIDVTTASANDGQYFSFTGLVSIYYFDDIRIDDVATKIGDHKIVRLDPNADGDDLWDEGAGGYGNINDWESGVDDDTTTEVTLAATSDNAEDNVDSTASLSIGSSDIINAIFAHAILKRGGGPSGSHYLRIRDHGSSDSDSADLALTNSYLFYRHQATQTMPSPSNLDSWQVGGIVSGARNFLGTAIGLMVDYTPVLAPVEITPGAGSLVATGAAPTVKQVNRVTPGAGSLTATGEAPTVRQENQITPDAGSLVATGEAPSLEKEDFITPDAGSLVATGEAPSLEKEDFITPDVGSLVASGAAPIVRQENQITPGAGSIAITGEAPSLKKEDFITPDAGAIAIAGEAPTVNEIRWITPGAGSLVVTGEQPTLNINRWITPGAGSITFAGYQPTVNEIRWITPGTGSLVITGEQPTVEEEAPGVDNITPGTGSLVVTGEQPTLNINRWITPGAGSLAATGAAPTVRQENRITPDAGSLVATGAAPSLKKEDFITPAAGELIMGVGSENVIGGQDMADADWVDEASPITNIQTDHDGQLNCRFCDGPIQFVDGFKQAPGNTFTTITGRKYRVTWLAKKGSGNIYTQVKRGSGVGNIVLMGAGPVSWQRYSVDYIETAGGSGAYLIFTASTGGGSFYVDEVTHNEVLNTPTVRTEFRLTPGAGSLTAAGEAPSLEKEEFITPATGSLIITGEAPSLEKEDLITPATGSLVITGYQPTVSLGGAVTITPDPGSLVAAGEAPDIRIEPPYRAVFNQKYGGPKPVIYGNKSKEIKQ